MLIYKKQVVKQMKIILSKKGLDSSYGGYPIKMQNDNDDTYWSLITIPIPIYDDPKSNKCMLKGENIKYVCHHMDGEPKGLINLYEKRVGDKIKVKDIAKSIEVDSNSVNKFLIHTDPYIINYSENDNYDYIGSFGQANSAQGHLRKQNVSIGDIFLFYGWYKFNSEPYERQVIFGYLQVDCIITLDKKYKSKLEQDKSIDKFEKDGVCLYFKRGGDLEYYENILENKLANQPHLKYIKECLNKNVSANDTIYIASENLRISIKNIDNKNLI